MYHNWFLRSSANCFQLCAALPIPSCLRFSRSDSSNSPPPPNKSIHTDPDSWHWIQTHNPDGNAVKLFTLRILPMLPCNAASATWSCSCPVSPKFYFVPRCHACTEINTHTHKHAHTHTHTHTHTSTQPHTRALSLLSCLWILSPLPLSGFLPWHASLFNEDVTLSAQDIDDTARNRLDHVFWTFSIGVMLH